MNKVIIATCMLMVGLVAILGLYLFLKGARHVQLAVASAKWLHTSGKAVSSETARDVATYRRPTSPIPVFSMFKRDNTSASLGLPGIGVVLLFMSLATFFWVVPALGKP
jgi:hypothetical protein